MSWYSIETCKIWEKRGVYDCPTASGKSLYDLEAQKVMFAASWEYPFGTKLKVTNLENGKSVIVTVLDKGPAKRLNRSLDLGRFAFQKIADERVGLINVSFTEVRI